MFDYIDDTIVCSDRNRLKKWFNNNLQSEKDYRESQWGHWTDDRFYDGFGFGGRMVTENWESESGWTHSQIEEMFD